MATIRTYVLLPDGSLQSHSESPLECYGECPNVGDTICLSFNRTKPEHYSVQRRYYVNNHDGHSGWAVVLREVEASPPIQALLKAWYDDDDDWDGFEEREAREEQERADQLMAHLLSPAKREPIDPPLDYRETHVMERLVSVGVGVTISANTVKQFGPSTRKKLVDRGFVRLSLKKGKAPGEEQVALTRKGLKLWKDQQAFDDDNPRL